MRSDLGLNIVQNIGTQVSVSGTTGHTLTIEDDDTAAITFQLANSSVRSLKSTVPLP